MNADMLSTPIIISYAFFIIIFIIVLLVSFRLRKKAVKKEMLIKIESPNQFLSEGTDEYGLQESAMNRLAAKYLGFVGKSIVPESSDDYFRMKRNFLHAGLNNPIVPPIFWGSKVVLAFGLPLICLLVKLLINQPMPAQTILIACFAFSIFGYYLPDILLHNKITRRRETIKKGLPDMLDLMVVCVEAGLGIDATLRRITDEISISHKELSSELRMYGLELNAGLIRARALRNLSSRVALEDFQNLISVLLQTERFGTSIANALRVYSESFRSKRYSVAEEKAAKLAVKITFPVILFIFPALFVVLAGPAAIRLFEIL
jgi:tight adherence protein C